MVLWLERPPRRLPSVRSTRGSASAGGGRLLLGPRSIDVIPGAFVTVTADRSGLAGDTAVYNPGTFAFFALVAQRAS